MSVISNNLLLTPEGYQISRSVRLRSSASAYFNRTPASAGNQQKWTWSGWVKFGSFTTGAGVRGASFLFGNLRTSNYTMIGLNPADSGASYQFGIESVVGTAGGSCRLYTAAVLRDPSAWYHLIMAVDTTQATAANRVRIYVNGVQQAITTVFTPAQNLSMYINESGASHGLGATYTSSYGNFDGVMTEVNFIDGQALTPSSFGETDSITGVWKPKKYAGTYGTNGFYLNFSDPSAATAAAIGKDSSGNGNNWTPNNISVTAGVTYDSMLDVPTMFADGGNGRGNYATLNPLDKAGFTIADGNLAFSAQSGPSGVAGTIAFPSTGKWYFESTVLTGTERFVGLINSVHTGSNLVTATSTQWVAYGTSASSGNIINKDGSNVQTGLTAWNANNVAGIAFDADAGTVQFYNNGVAVGTAVSVTTGVIYTPWLTSGNNNYNNFTANINFGQRPFAYTPPTGFKALNTQNLPDSTIPNGRKYFDTLLWTSTATVKDVTGSDFQPDLVWVKSRASSSANEGYHHLVDAVRGAGKVLSSNATDAEYWTGTNNSVQAFLSNGFTAGDADGLNGNAMVSWLWKESASAGFDIVTYTGTGVARTIAHSLGVAPSMMIVKSRSSGTYDWEIYHQSLGPSKYLLFNTNAAATGLNEWNNTAPTSSVFSLGTGTGVNSNGNTFVAYLFAEVAGFSKFGSYTGNGSADGPFVYCGFRPKFVMIKRTDAAGFDWAMLDSSRLQYNVNNLTLMANTSAVEGTNVYSDDFLSNGFKVRDAGTGQNASGGTYIFAAFAENPFKNSLAR